jgi:hypothetical protein
MFLLSRVGPLLAYSTVERNIWYGSALVVSIRTRKFANRRADQDLKKRLHTIQDLSTIPRRV